MIFRLVCVRGTVFGVCLGAYWRQMANTMERSVGGGDASCRYGVATCFKLIIVSRPEKIRLSL